MGRPALPVQFLLVALATALVTSGIWIGAYFAVRSKETHTTNVSCPSIGSSGSGNGTGSPNDEPVPANDDPKCTESCHYSLVESIPVGLTFSSPTFNSTYETWMELMNRAESEIDIISYYWTLNPEDTGDGFKNDSTADYGMSIFNNIIKTAQRNITIRIVQNSAESGYAETAYLEKHGYAQVRTMNFTRFFGAGILHTKAWIVDKKHFYVGSANLDWRSLRQVKELGVGVFDCPCLGNDMYKLFELNWEMGAPMKEVPKQFPDALATYYNQQNPMQVTLAGQPSAVYLSAAPPQLRAAGRENDGDAILKTIRNAQKFVHISVMDYIPATLYYKDNFYWPLIDEALRSAAFDRGVHDFYAHLHSLASINGHLSCRKYYDPTAGHNECINGTQGSIEVRLFEVPLKGWEHIPYARVNHNKYMVTDNTAYIGTSNWSGDYFLVTGGIGFVLQGADVTMSRRLGLVTVVHALLGSFGDIEANILNFMTIPVRKMFNESVERHYGIVLHEETFNLVYSSVAVTFFVGILVGAVLMGYLMDFYGRKETGVIVRSSLGIICGVCMYLSGTFCSIELFIIGHFIAGLVNVLKIVLIIYVAECSPDKSRGLTAMALGSGGFIVVLMATPLCLPTYLGNDTNWTILPALCAVLSAVHLTISLMFPQSPKHLYITLHDKEKCRETISFYHGPAADLDAVEEEYEQERLYLQQGHATVKEVWNNKTLRRSLIIISICAFVPAASAINVKSQYHAAMLMSFGLTQSQAMLAIMVILLGGSPLCLLAPWLIERMGRRPLILLVCGLCVGEWLLLGSAQFVVDMNIQVDLLSSTLGIIGSIFGQAANMLGLLTFTAILISEMCPHTARAAISQVAQIIPIVFAMATVLLYPLAVQIVGFMFHAFMVIVSAMLLYACYAMIPETKGLPVDEIMHKISCVDHPPVVRSESREELINRPARYGSMDSSRSYDEI
ncbi:hypothetical protein QR680_004126 [Steinernema hermaphroditum]|uniref:Major facilitator superfamily (MFS) profile domain-containing protein n=1 Tax=Steinernema hermaphroditum TaxID=289476 RepID=A0AA39HPX8_9BILA|nr:hypothetical protein QR680_004126 [Steinernema hermaphroditum]